MRIHILVSTIFLFTIFKLSCMEEKSGIIEASDKEIENWIDSILNDPNDKEVSDISPFMLEPTIYEPSPQKPACIGQLIRFFEDASDHAESSSETSSKPASPRKVISPTKLLPIDRILITIRAADYKGFFEVLQQNPEVINEKKKMLLCSLLKPKNCKKSEQLSQKVSALILSCYHKNHFMVTHLLENGADPNLPGHNGITPLLVATYNDCNDIAKQLLDAGADVDRPDNNNNTPTTIALERKNIILVNLFKKLKPVHKLSPSSTDPILPHAKKPSAIDRYQQQQTWLTRLFSAISAGNSNEVHQLMNSGIKDDINALFFTEAPSIYTDNVSKRMLTALHYATYKNNSDAIKILLAYGANANAFEHYAVTPLMIAASSGRTRDAHTLLLNGAIKSLRETSGNLTAAEIAIKARKDETYRVIMDYNT